MKRCPKCGAELDDQVRFCYQCGEMLGAGAVQTSGPEVDDDDDEDNMQTIIIGGSTEEEEAPESVSGEIASPDTFDAHYAEDEDSSEESEPAEEPVSPSAVPAEA